MLKLLNTPFSWTGFFSEMLGNSEAGTAGNEAVTKALDWVTNGVWILFGLVGLAGVIYSIYLGIQLARAEDQSKRDDAKKHLTTVIIALGVTLLLVVFFLHLLPAIVYAFSNVGKTT